MSVGRRDRGTEGWGVEGGYGVGVLRGIVGRTDTGAGVEGVLTG